MKNFTLITLTGELPFAVAADSKLLVKTMQEFIDYAKAESPNTGLNTLKLKT